MGRAGILSRGPNDARSEFRPDGKFLALGGEGGPLLYDVVRGKPARRFELPGGFVECVAFSPDGKVLAGGGDSKDFDVRLWDVATGKSLAAFMIPAGPGKLNFPYEVRFSPDGKTLTARGFDETITVWDVPD